MLAYRNGGHRDVSQPSASWLRGPKYVASTQKSCKTCDTCFRVPPRLLAPPRNAASHRVWKHACVCTRHHARTTACTRAHPATHTHAHTPPCTHHTTQTQTHTHTPHHALTPCTHTYTHAHIHMRKHTPHPAHTHTYTWNVFAHPYI